MNILGIIGSVILSITMIPQLVLVIRQGHANGISLWAILGAIVGLLCMDLYLWSKNGFDILIQGQYGLTILVYLLILRYRLK